MPPSVVVRGCGSCSTSGGGSPFAALATVVCWVDSAVALFEVAFAVERSEVLEVVSAPLGVGDVVVGLECHGVEVVEGGVDCLSAPVAYGAGCSFEAVAVASVCAVPCVAACHGLTLCFLNA